MKGSFYLFIFYSLFIILSSVSAHELQAHVMQLDDSGFHPNTIEIKQGDTVEFVIKGFQPHWPASDIHPTHQIYPEFDPKEPVQPGKSWSFQFEKAGHWNCHDHLSPEHTCQITVQKDPDFVSSQKTRPPSFQEKFNQFTENLRTWFLKKYFSFFPNAKQAQLDKLSVLDVAKNETKLRLLVTLYSPVDLLKKLNKEADNSPQTCHQAAHQLGRVTYLVEGANAFQIMDPTCSSGVLHGAMEGFLRDKGTTDLARNITGLCQSVSTQFNAFTCWHGIGHGLMAYNNYNLPETLKFCKSLGKSNEQIPCYGGAFMENVVVKQGFGAVPGHQTTWLNSDPQFPCNAIDQDQIIQSECYARQPNWLFELEHNNIDAVIQDCLKVPNDAAFACFMGVGRDTYWTNSNNINRVKEVCDKVPQIKDYHQYCLRGALNEIVIDFGGQLEDQATDFCKILSEDDKKFCYGNLAGQLGYVFGNNRDRQKAVCAGFEAKYQYLCTNL